MDKCIDSRGQEYLSSIFNKIAHSMGCDNPEKAIAAIREMMKDTEMTNPVAGNREEEIDVLSNSVNPVRLKNNPVSLSNEAIYQLYGLIVD